MMAEAKHPTNLGKNKALSKVNFKCAHFNIVSQFHIIVVILNLYNMKSKFYLFGMLAVLTMSTVACNECVTCTHPSGSEVELCKKNYRTVPGLYKAEVENFEDNGYTCE